MGIKSRLLNVLILNYDSVAIAFAVLFAVLVALSSDAYAFRGYSWYVAPLTPELVEKYMKCAPSVARADWRIRSRKHPTKRGDRGRLLRRLIYDETERVLKVCGFPPDAPEFRSVEHSIYLAFGFSVDRPSGIVDEKGKYVAENDGGQTRSKNAELIVPYRARLTSFFMKQEPFYMKDMKERNPEARATSPEEDKDGIRK